MLKETWENQPRLYYNVNNIVPTLYPYPTTWMREYSVGVMKQHRYFQITTYLRLCLLKNVIVYLFPTISIQ